MRLLAFALAVVLVAAQDCNVDDSNKRDCGHVGTDEQQCLASGCCWGPNKPSNVPWCFYPNSGPPPPVPPPVPPPPPGQSPFAPSEIATMEQYFFNNLNINGFGGVVAAPDNNTKGGSYYFHWMRDAAITMHVVQTYVDPAKAEQLMQSYVKWVVRAQSDPDPNGIDVRGEPKFLLPNGGPFGGGWCRPQNDGAGLRAWALGQYALSLIASGNTNFVRTTLFGGSGNGTVRRDCDYVTSAWQQTGNNCDLWEELRGDFFFTKMAQRRGLLMCQQVAAALSDPSADGYGATAKQIQASLDAHWNGQFLFEASARQKDSAVILGLLYGDNSDGYLPLTDPKVTATVAVLNTLFHGMFPLNAKDDALGLGGIFWGRYEGDNYAGGHPWVLSTAALADVYYRQARLVLDRARRGQALSNPELLGLRAQLRRADDPATLDSPEALARALALDGDGVLQRIRYHVAPLQFHLPEQLDKDTGGFANAHDLTWSYGSVFLALHSRSAFYAAL